MKDNFSDEELIGIYNLGWDSEYHISNKTIESSVYSNPLAQKAYDIGRSDYEFGDDIKQLDYQTNEKILNKIKNEV